MFRVFGSLTLLHRLGIVEGNIVSIDADRIWLGRAVAEVPVLTAADDGLAGPTRGVEPVAHILVQHGRRTVGVSHGKRLIRVPMLLTIAPSIYRFGVLTGRQGNGLAPDGVVVNWGDLC